MRLFSNRLSIAVVAALAVAPCARAADPELLVIKATALELDKDHVDPSYTQISDATQAIFGRAIRSGDYYTGLRMTFEIDKESLVKNCSGGSSAGWYYVANVSIDYQGKKGRKLVSFVAGVPLVVAASNYDQKAGKLVKGCLLKLAPDTDPAYVLAEDFAAGEGEYRIRIEPLYGVTKDATVFQKVADLGLKIVAAWGASLFTINPQQAAVVTAVATDIDYLRSRDTQRSGDFTGTLRPSGSASKATAYTRARDSRLPSRSRSDRRRATERRDISPSIRAGALRSCSIGPTARLPRQPSKSRRTTSSTISRWGQATTA